MTIAAFYTKITAKQDFKVDWAETSKVDWKVDNNITVSDVVMPAPMPAFSVDVREGDAPLAVAFTNASTSNTAITSRLWTFGDGATSTSASPSHTYTVPGEYAVTLKVVFAAGSNEATTIDGFIVVTEAPEEPEE